MLTGLAILERELGSIDYVRHRLRRRLASRLPAAEAGELRRQLKGLDRRRDLTLAKLDELTEEYEERPVKAAEAIHERASTSPRRLRESPESARRRLGLPPR